MSLIFERNDNQIVYFDSKYSSNIPIIYQLSYQYYGVIGALVTIIGGYLISFITGPLESFYFIIFKKSLKVLIKIQIFSENFFFFFYCSHNSLRKLSLIFENEVQKWSNNSITISLINMFLLKGRTSIAEVDSQLFIPYVRRRVEKLQRMKINSYVEKVCVEWLELILLFVIEIVFYISLNI